MHARLEDDSAKRILSPTQATRQALRSLLLAMEIEVLQVRESLTATASFPIMIAAMRANELGNEPVSSVLDVLKGAPPGMRRFLALIGEIRTPDVPQLLGHVTALADSSAAMEAYPAQSLCATMLIVTHMALEELGTRIDGWQALPGHMHSTLVLLERAALAIGGWEDLSASDRSKKWASACADADVRVGAAMVVDAFAKVVRKWRTQGLDRQAFLAKDGDVPHAQTEERLAASQQASTAAPLSSSVNFASLGGEMDNFMASLFSDDNTDWTALFSALQG